MPGALSVHLLPNCLLIINFFGEIVEHVMCAKEGGQCALRKMEGKRRI